MVESLPLRFFLFRIIFLVSIVGPLDQTEIKGCLE